MDANSKRRPRREAPLSEPAGGDQADARILSHETQVQLLIGEALDRAVGKRVTCARRPSAVREALLSSRQDDAPDAWVILGRFADNRRASAGWQAASGPMVDLDYEDPAIPRDEGAHQVLPAELRSRIAAAIAEFPLAGFAYLTPRGLRWGCVFSRDVEHAEIYAELAAGAAERLLEHFRELGIPLWRDGVKGLRYDATSAKPEQPMRLPAPCVPILLTGGDWPIYPTDLQGEDVPRLDLDAALPPELADACRQIGRWIQVAPEVVVTGLMALAAAAIGNTRWVCTRGFAVPLSLHYLTVLPAGSGKSTVRGFLRRAISAIQREVLRQRAKVIEEANEYVDAMDAWRQDRRSKKTRAAAGPRPQPPAMSPRGGIRASFMVSEGTLEGIIATLEDTPRGFLWASDEAHEVLGLLGRYGDGQGARSLDAARLRRLMQSEPVEAHRAKSNAAAIRRLPRPWLSIDADVQPGVFSMLFADEDRVSGMTARFLAHAPPTMQGHRKYVDPPPEPGDEVLDLIQTRIEALWRVELELREGMAWYRPLALDPDAERLWAQELERLEGRYSGASDEEAGVLGHARGRILRFAGVLALLCDPGATAVTLVDMRRALVHMRYHLAHHQRFQRQSEVAGDRMDRLREQVERIHQRQPEIGVRPSDLRNNVDKSHYGGATGIQRALANLHALGWNLRRPKTPKGRSGRRAVPAFFPPGPGKPSAKSAKPPVRVDIADLADKIPGRTPDAQGVTDAGELIETASQRLLAAGSVSLPRRGERVACPACGSPDGLGVLPDDHSRWYCHSDRHAGPRGGGAVDYFLAQRLERMPSVPEAVEEAKQILGLWDPPLQQEQEVAGPGGALSAAPQEGPHADWSEDAREEYEERAAIVEFEGGLSRQEAQILAEVSVRERWRQGGGRG